MTTINAPGPNYQPDTTIISAFNRTGGALTLGQVVQLDLHNSAGEVDNNNLGGVDSGFGNVIDVEEQEASLEFGVFGIALEATANDDRGPILLRGHCRALVGSTAGGTPANYMGLTAKAATDFLEMDVAAAHKIIGILLESGAALGALASRSHLIWFNGVEGFGNKA